MNLNKHMVTLIVLLAVGASSCGGHPNKEIVFSESLPDGILINTLNGQTDVPVDDPFIFQFDYPVYEGSVVSAGILFIRTPQRDLATSSTEFDSSVCSNLGGKLNLSSPQCEGDRCAIKPLGPLAKGVTYTICLMPTIRYEDSTEPFEGFMATFMTETEPLTFETELIDIRGHVLDRQTAIPIRVSLRFDLERYLKYEYLDYEYDERSDFEMAIALVDEDESKVEGRFEWNSSYDMVEFIPDMPLRKHTSYRVVVDTDMLPGSEQGKALSSNMASILTFKTMMNGDVDGDGYADVLVGAREDGYAHLVFGSSTPPTLSNTPEVTRFYNYRDGGYSVSIVGDVNADGFADFVITDPTYDNYFGRASIYLGSSNRHALDPSEGPYATYGGSDVTGYGDKVARAGDFNGDGYDDFMVAFGNGANECVGIYINGRNSGERDYVYAPVRICTDESDVLWFGKALAGGGDFNGDGYADIAIGIESSSNDRVYIYFGRSTAYVNLTEEDADIVITRADDPLGFVSSLAMAGDVDGDGRDDLLVGSNLGGAYLFSGSQFVEDLDAASAFASIEGIVMSDHFGETVAGGGDLDGDGLDDIVVGHWGYPDQSFDEYGRAYVFFGSHVQGPLTSDDADVILTGATSIDQLSFSMLGGYDVDGDGYDDLLVGAPQDTKDPGRLYIFKGAPEMSDCDMSDSCASWSQLEGMTNNDYFGVVD